MSQFAGEAGSGRRAQPVCSAGRGRWNGDDSREILSSSGNSNGLRSRRRCETRDGDLCALLLFLVIGAVQRSVTAFGVLCNGDDEFSFGWTIVTAR